LIGEKDMEIFKSLKKVELELYEGKNDFKLHFTFEENDFFTNTVLSKRMIYSEDKDLAD
jgi:nucleosome assembly protein 1-like 1